MKIITRLLVLSLASISLIQLFNPQVAGAQSSSLDYSCYDYLTIFARGSGQVIADEEADAFRFTKQIETRLSKSNLQIGQYQLGSEVQNGASYPAINVSDIRNGNLLGAVTSAGLSFDYGNSVATGIKELISYTNTYNQNCPSGKIILAGYSQGAQVMGQALSQITPHIREQIEFVALFGDPKLHLPEGEGLLPPACKGEQFSSWRREIGNCHTDNGSLQARKPYLPSDMVDKVGLWCLARDVVCGSTKNIFTNDGHEKYKEPEGPIDQSVQEIVSRISKDNPDAKDINTLPLPDQKPTNGPDVMFILDNSISMTENYYTNHVKPRASILAEQVIAQGGRVGMATFDGCNRAQQKQNFTQPSNSTSTFLRKLNAIQLYPSRCDLSRDLLDTIADTKQRTQWKSGVKRLFVVMTRTPFVNPLIISPANALDTHSAKLINEEPVPDSYIYPIIPEEIKESFEEFNVEGSQTKIVQPEEFEDVIEEQTTNPQLIAHLTSSDYKVLPGDVLHFDASPSLVHDDKIIRYDWDFDGDDIIDSSTSMPTIEHTYQDLFEGQVSLTVTTETGLVNRTVATVSIYDPASIPAEIPAPNVQVKRTSSTSAKLSWQTANSTVENWAISVNGVVLGKVAKDQFSITINDLLIDQDNQFTVRAISPEGELGKEGIAGLKKEEPKQNFTLRDLLRKLLSFWWQIIR